MKLYCIPQANRFSLKKKLIGSFKKLIRTSEQAIGGVLFNNLWQQKAIHSGFQ
ncbi:MAG: hypothetical protein RIG62_30250 [Cyclobacteriaceae bacterium]